MAEAQRQAHDNGHNQNLAKTDSGSRKGSISLMANLVERTRCLLRLRRCTSYSECEQGLSEVAARLSCCGNDRSQCFANKGTDVRMGSISRMSSLVEHIRRLPLIPLRTKKGEWSMDLMPGLVQELALVQAQVQALGQAVK